MGSGPAKSHFKLESHAEPAWVGTCEFCPSLSNGPFPMAISYGASGLTRTLLHHQDGWLRPAGYQLQDGTTVEAAAAYGYDDAGRLKQVDGTYPLPSTPAFRYDYAADSAALLESMTGPAHTVTHTWESNRDVLSRKENKVGSATISSYDYSVNAIGQRTAVEAGGSAYGSTSRELAWGYDTLGQVVKEADGTTAANSRGYLYDAVGNRLASITGSTDASSSGATTYVTNGLNQYGTITNATPSPMSLSYDDDGNAVVWPVRYGPWVVDNRGLEWDAENRLIAYQSVVTVHYTYDYLGRRIGKAQGTTRVETIYEGWNPIGEYHGSGSSVPVMVKKYLWGKDLSGSIQGAGGVGGLLAVTDSSGTYYPTYDGNGNVSEYLNSSGVNVAHFEYDAFGNGVRLTEQSSGFAGKFPHRFSTKPQDVESGLYYYGYRFYDPVTGRWPSRDPIEELGGNNLYGFVLNNPLFYIDVLGNQISIPAGVAGAAAAGWSATDIAATFGVSLAIAQAAIQAERCKVLRAAVKAAKQAVGAVAGKCKCTDSPEVIAAKTAAWCALAEARWNQNQECFSGGDPTHVEEQQKAYDKCVECKNTVSNQP